MTPIVHGNTALFLDIDGTLLDLARTPDAVVVPGDLQRALVALAGQLGGALAFVSGRPLSAIDRLFAPLRTAAIGCHGAEVRGADGKVEALAAPVPDAIRTLFRSLAARHPGVLLEDKVFALALHYRLAPEARAPLLAALAARAELLSESGIGLIEGKAVIDARPHGVDKALGVRALLQQRPFLGRPVLFGGDDTTDMDVFRILPTIGGRGFSVGRHFSGAQHVFASPMAVRQCAIMPPASSALMSSATDILMTSWVKPAISSLAMPSLPAWATISPTPLAAIGMVALICRMDLPRLLNSASVSLMLSRTSSMPVSKSAAAFIGAAAIIAMPMVPITWPPSSLRRDRLACRVWVRCS